MKVTVLGGAAAGGNPGQGCSGYLFSSDQTHIVVDLGPGTLLELRKHTDYRTLDAIFVSHMHVDHYLDLAALRYALAYNPIKPGRKVPLLLPPGGCDHLQALGRAFSIGTNDEPFFESCFDMSDFDPDAEVSVGDLRITFEATVHYIPTWAVRIRDETGKSVGYTADTGPCESLTSFFSGVDLLVCESTFVTRGSDDPPRLHLTAAEAGRLARVAEARRLLLTHTWSEFGTQDYLDHARRDFSGPISLATPGMAIEV